MRSWIAVPSLTMLVACAEAGESTLSPLAQDGERVYQNVCIACHNGDPTLDSALGPAIAGSSAELLDARVIRGSYPPGYSPKRAGSGLMPAFPYLEDQIPALAAYLREVEGNESGG